MRSGASIWMMVVFLATGVLGRPAFAQDDGELTAMERITAASYEEMAEFARTSLTELRDIVKEMVRMDTQVRQDVDGGVLCVTNNLAAARALFQVTEKAAGALEDAIGVGERSRAEHEVRKIAIAVRSGRTLMADAERCAYGEGIADGKTRVKIEGVPDDDDQGGDEDDDGSEQNYGFDPPNASPF